MAKKRISVAIFLMLLSMAMLCAGPVSAQGPTKATGFQPSDLSRFQSVGTVAFSPDGRRLAYSITYDDLPGRPFSQIWVMDISARQSRRLGGERESTSTPVWSPNGRWIAYYGMQDTHRELKIAAADGSASVGLAEVADTNAPLPHQGHSMTWSPDSKRIAFISATPGLETAAATGDPMVFTRYLWRPTAEEGINPYNDNRRLHIFVVTVDTKKVEQLTSGDNYEHSIDWSPNGEEILFLSDHEANSDEFFHYNLFELHVADGSIRPLISSEATEYVPVWSPDGKSIAYLGTQRGLTDRETNMEDTHVWVMNADGSKRREIGAAIDDRQGAPEWAADGSALYFTVQERGNVRLYRLPVNGGAPQHLVDETGAVGAFSVGKDGAIAYSFASQSDFSELFLRPAAGGAARKLTDLNRQVLGSKEIAPVESFTFLSNDFTWNVEAFLTKPIGFTPEHKYPLILNIHGGPHGQQGPELSFRNQVYAAHGYAVLNVNYRGSTGYGQKFADAVFADQDGHEAMDVLYAVNAALRRYPWIDRERLGIEGVSYGGQLTDWLITQTNIFKAAIPIAGIANFISYNYMTYYNQYEAMEWGAYPHQGNLMNVLWERSALKHVAKVSTPTMFMHGENDPDVPIAEAEQMYIALKDVGVETVFVRYPREGHGLREPKHQVDSMERAFAWYDRHFAAPQPKPTPAIP